MTDLHCDHWKTNKTFLDFFSVPADTDMIALTGDLGTWLAGYGEDNPIVQRIIRPLNELGIPIFTVPGNHEYYGGDIVETDKEMEEVSYLFDNWHHLQCGQCRVVDDWLITGATLWTPLFGIGNPIRSKKAMRDMNDRKYIRSGGERFTYKTHIQTHEAHKQGIMAALAAHPELKSLVLTHHAPTLKHVAPRYMHETCTPAYAFEIGKEIRPDVWCSGHTHYNVYFEKGRTLFISNPLGYPGEGRDPFEGVYEI